MKKTSIFLYLSFLLGSAGTAQNPTNKLPETDISGVYEVMVGTKNAQESIRYFAEMGFSVVDSAVFSSKQAQDFYGVPSSLKSYRLQNGKIDSHGLVRLLQWEKPLGEGVGYAPIESLGSRLSAARVSDIFRLHDIYQLERKNGKKWLVTEPIFDDMYKISEGKLDYFNRPVGVRENAAYGDFFNHVFFQRYGYQIVGYGTIDASSPLQVSEFTHHSFVIKADSMGKVSRYYSEALGLQPEQPEPVIDGDWQKGAQKVFDMEPGYSHWYRGFVSPNNVCGKVKLFLPRSPKPDKTANQRIGELGITLHSFYTPKLKLIHDLLKKQQIKPSAIFKNEFNENCFIFRGTDGVNWQIIERLIDPKNKPVTKFEIVKVKN